MIHQQERQAPNLQQQDEAKISFQNQTFSVLQKQTPVHKFIVPTIQQLGKAPPTGPCHVVVGCRDATINLLPHFDGLRPKARTLDES